MKKLADFLTGLRFVLSFLIVWITWMSSPEEGIGILVLLTLLAWTSDVLDGPLARRAAVSRQTWLGAHDLEADLSLVLALSFSLAAWRGASTALLAGTLLVGMFGRLIFHSPAPIRLGMGIIYGLFIRMALGLEPSLGAAIVAWIGTAMLLNRSRTHAQVTGFLSDCQKIKSGLASRIPFLWRR